MSNYAYNTKQANVRADASVVHGCFDKLVFRQM